MHCIAPYELHTVADLLIHKVELGAIRQGRGVRAVHQVACKEHVAECWRRTATIVAGALQHRGSHLDRHWRELAGARRRESPVNNDGVCMHRVSRARKHQSCPAMPVLLQLSAASSQLCLPQHPKPCLRVQSRGLPGGLPWGPCSQTGWGPSCPAYAGWQGEGEEGLRWGAGAELQEPFT